MGKAGSRPGRGPGSVKPCGRAYMCMYVVDYFYIRFRALNRMRTWLQSYTPCPRRQSHGLEHIEWLRLYLPVDHRRDNRTSVPRRASLPERCMLHDQPCRHADALACHPMQLWLQTQVLQVRLTLMSICLHFGIFPMPMPLLALDAMALAPCLKHTTKCKLVTKLS